MWAFMCAERVREMCQDVMFYKIFVNPIGACVYVGVCGFIHLTFDFIVT